MSVVVTEDHFGPQHPNIVTRDLEWDARARSIYDRLLNDSVLSGWVPGQEEWDETLVVDGTHKLTKGLRLRQLCSGFLQDELSTDVRWIHHAKEQAILADLGELLGNGEYVVISYTFTEAGIKLVEEIGKTFGRDVVALCNGRTRNVTEILSLFDARSKVPTKLRVIVLQEKVGSVGISLARARHLFFHSGSMDSAIHDQMLHRIWEPSRASNITYYQMVNSADGFARQIVQNKLDASVMAHRVGLYAAMMGKKII
jgi:hypothetical protein